MALPTLNKTWEHKVNITALGSADTEDNHQDYLWKVKEALVNGAGVAGSFTTPWTVWGSGNGAGSLSNGTGVDYWPTAASILFGNGTAAHSWIVLQQSAINTKFQICIETNTFGTQRDFTLVVSPAAGFGAANGGTDGTNNARPTATDERVLQSQNRSGVQYNTWNGYYHIMMSDDGECTRILLIRDNYVTAFWWFDKPKSPISAWADAAVFGFRGNSDATTNEPIYGYFNDLASLAGRIGGDPVNFYCTSDMYGGGMVGQNITVPDDQTGEWPMMPMGLACENGGHQGVRKGVLYDIWWASAATYSGDTYPGDASKQFAQFGNMIFPWDGSNPSV